MATELLYPYLIVASLRSIYSLLDFFKTNAGGISDILGSICDSAKVLPPSATVRVA
jgi:hypothetical protein